MNKIFDRKTRSCYVYGLSLLNSIGTQASWSRSSGNITIQPNEKTYENCKNVNVENGVFYNINAQYRWKYFDLDDKN